MHFEEILRRYLPVRVICEPVPSSLKAKALLPPLKLVSFAISRYKPDSEQNASARERKFLPSD